MCNLETEGTKFGCGHYQATRTIAKYDCNNQWCSHSRRHRTPCDPCHCERYLGPDVKEVITLTRNDYCESCQYWYKGAGAGQRRR